MPMITLPSNKKIHDLMKKYRHKRTFSFKYQDQVLWIKQPFEDATSFYRTGLLKIGRLCLIVLAKITGNPLFIPTSVKAPYESLSHEAQRIEQLKQHGFAVPTLLDVQPNYLLMQDSGPPLSQVLNEVNPQQANSIIKQLSQQLARMHNLGFYHSRPALRDFTYQNGVITFLDFEEDLSQVLTTEQAILRDGLVYIHALFRKLDSKTLIHKAISEYKEHIHTDYWDTLVIEIKRYRLIYKILSLFSNKIGKDGQAIYLMLNYFIHPTLLKK